MNSWQKYGKTWMELLGAIIMAAVVTYRELALDGVTISEWIMIVIAVAGVLNVWAAANITNFNKAKTLVSAGFVVLNLLVGFLTDNRLTGDETMLLVIQALSTLGVGVAPSVKNVVERKVVAA